MLPFPETRCFGQCTPNQHGKESILNCTYDYFDLGYSPPEMTSLDGYKAQDCGGNCDFISDHIKSELPIAIQEEISSGQLPGASVGIPPVTRS